MTEPQAPHREAAKKIMAAWSDRVSPWNESAVAQIIADSEGAELESLWEALRELANRENYQFLGKFINWEAAREFAERALSSVPAPTKEPVNISRGCNRHSDCKKAEADLLARNPGMAKTNISPAFHCHDDECEDCFGC